MYITGVRIEWSKSRARAHRFTEEVQLLSTEMSRILCFFNFQAEEWERRGRLEKWDVTGMSGPQREGHCAYAARQATMFKGLRAKCIELWKDLPAYMTRMTEIVENPDLAEPGEFDRSSASQARTSKPKAS